MIRVIAVRHGETDWNRIRRLQGHTDIPLNDNGIAQAARLAVALRNEAIVAIHASDLSRAVATAAPVADALHLLVVHSVHLRERHYGILEGKTFPEILEAFPEEAEKLRLRDADHTIPGGESQRTFFHRVVRAATGSVEAEVAAGRVDPDAEPGADAAVLIVAHGGVLDMLHRAATGLALDAERTCPIPNAVINRLEYDAGRFAVVSWAEVPGEAS